MLLFDDLRFDDHDAGPMHPERAARLSAVREGLSAFDWERRPAQPADAAALRLIHTPEHVQRILSAEGRSVAVDADTLISPGSVLAARLAVGAALEGAEALLDGVPSFVLCRPPGHHAAPNRAMGFCLFNNAALAAARLAAAGQRVLVFDPDVHHGNGTEAAFWEVPEVLFVSLHQAPFYPGTGATRATGGGAGAGTTVNTPLPAGADDAWYAEAMRARVVPAIRAFKPDVCVISAGFDALEHDPLGGMRLSAGGLAAVWSAVMEDGLPAMAVLEGGYDLENLRQGVSACAAVLAGESRPALVEGGVPASWQRSLRSWGHPLLS